MVNSSGAASGGPMIAASAWVDCSIPAARARSVSPGTISPRIATLAGMKKVPAALTPNTMR